MIRIKKAAVNVRGIDSGKEEQIIIACIGSSQCHFITTARQKQRCLDTILLCLEKDTHRNLASAKVLCLQGVSWPKHQLGFNCIIILPALSIMDEKGVRKWRDGECFLLMS